MLQAYLNYPNSRVTVHGDPTCEEIEKMDKLGQRHVFIDRDSLEGELARFWGTYAFASTAPLNDMWVTVDMGDLLEEQRVLDRIVATLGRRYTPFGRAVPSRHCEEL